MRRVFQSFRRCEYAADVCSTAVRSNHPQYLCASVSRTEARSTARLVTQSKLQRVLNAAIESFKFCTTKKNKPLVTAYHGHSDEATVQRLGEAITLSNWSGGAGERTKPKPVDINLHKQGTHANLSPKMANSRLSLSRSAIPPPRPS